MAVFENFPYTNFHELNLDWIIAKVKEYVQKTEAAEISYQALKSYVENYFDNLDVQEEIDNKLDEMLQNGELASLIAQFLSTESLLVFNTIADLVAATNLVNGVSVMTLGNTVYNDGETNLYKVRTLTSSDVIDGVNIIALTNYPTLIAEKLTKTVDTGKKYVFIGDSYLAGWTDDQGTITDYGTIFKNRLGLTENVDYFKSAVGGTGFGHMNNDKNFSIMLQDLAGTMTTEQTESITDIFVMGGFNDIYATATEIYDGAVAFMNTAQTYFPNADVHVGIIGWSRDKDLITRFADRVLNNVLRVISTYPKAHYMNNIETSLIDKTLIDTGGNHPNANGQIEIANNIFKYINTGYVETVRHAFATVTGIDPSYSMTGSIEERFINNAISFCMFNVEIKFATGVNMGFSFVDYFTLTNDFLFGTSRLHYTVMAIFQANGTFSTHPLEIAIEDSKIRMRIKDVNSTGNNYLTLNNVTNIQILFDSKVITAVNQY